MPGLLDIGPAYETVEIRNVALEVRGVSAEAIVDLFQRFGNVFEVFQAAPGTAQIAAALKPAIAAIIAAATGNPGDANAEAKAAELSVGETAALLAAVRRLTMPKGLRPFMEDLRDIGLPLGGLLDQPAAAPTSEPS